MLFSPASQILADARCRSAPPQRRSTTPAGCGRRQDAVHEAVKRADSAAAGAAAGAGLCGREETTALCAARMQRSARAGTAWRGDATAGVAAAIRDTVTIVHKAAVRRLWGKGTIFSQDFPQFGEKVSQPLDKGVGRVVYLHPKSTVAAVGPKGC